MSLQAAVRMKPDADLSAPALKASMRKTYTDCYKMKGFLGGDWGYAVSTNSPGGREVDLIQGRLEGEHRVRVDIHSRMGEHRGKCIFGQRTFH